MANEAPDFLCIEWEDGDFLLCGSSEDVDEDDLEAGSILSGYGVDQAPRIPNLASAILGRIEGGQGWLNMAHWHGYPHNRCGSTHCIAGWAIHLAGEAGEALELECGAKLAGALIWAASCPGEPIPSFSATTPNDVALADLRERAAKERAESEVTP